MIVKVLSYKAIRYSTSDKSLVSFECRQASSIIISSYRSQLKNLPDNSGQATSKGEFFTTTILNWLHILESDYRKAAIVCR
jgi:hypothetical protein